MEYGEDVKCKDFIPIAGWIANAWDPCEHLRATALKKLCAKHSDNVSNLQQQGKSDQSAEIELWNPCRTTSFPPSEKAFIDQIEKQDNERSRRNLQVREANLFAWRILYGFGEGPWTVSRKATPQDLATQSRWVQLGWPIHQSCGALCPNDCVCSICVHKCGGLTDNQVFKLLRKRHPMTSVEELRATISARRCLTNYCADTLRGLRRRTNMVKHTRREIEDRVRAEYDWASEDQIAFFTDRHEFERRMKELVGLIDRIGYRPLCELEQDKIDAKHRSVLEHCFRCKKLVRVTDPASGNLVIGKIDCAIRSTRLGAGNDPDWVNINGTWYRDNEVSMERAKNLDIHQSSERLDICPNLDKFHVNSAEKRTSCRQMLRATLSEDQLSSTADFAVDDIVRITDQATGNTVTDRIDATWSSGFVMAKGVQYAEDDAAHATTPERDSYLSSEATPDSPTHSDTPQANPGYGGYGSSESESFR